ncbi:DUF2207 domain-containing protein [Rhizobium sp. Leaf371]|uniref:DUF2207 domain-containing protein n=1 Tax=Rhizobium sp. Leaf371 TaxID=1736355 RepID=UPI0009E92706|nr:DUF2207 domain-containing protein [Rhizobium sp. Leaf371]
MAQARETASRLSRFVAGLGVALLLLALLLLAGLTAGPAAAEERILSYDAQIEVARDGTLTVTETIRAIADGNLIKRGIYRDFPLTYATDDGRTHRVGFNLVSVERDGQSEPSRTENIDGGIRIYTGDKDVFLEPGVHTFALTYTTDRQIRYFEDHDELFWNVTGTGWAFPIDEASATVLLPGGARPQALNVFTGAYGSKEKNARGSPAGNGATFRTTQPLGPNEGLTIVMRLKKGVIAPPSEAQLRAAWWQENMAAILAGVGLLVVAVYYGWIWRRAGRDPDGGVVVPRWDPPENASPALVNYIDNRGFADGGWTAISAAALNLAVTGRVVLEDLKSALVIAATGKTPTGKAATDTLPTGEAALMRAVEAAGGRLVIDRENGPAVQKAGDAFRKAMESEHRGKYYKANIGAIIAGIALSIVFILAILVLGTLDDAGAAIVIVPVIIAVFVAIFIAVFGRSIRRKSSFAGRIAGIVVLTVIGFVGVTVFGGLVASIAFDAVETHQLPLLAGIGGIVLVNLVFLFLMGAPTPVGARLSAHIAGLRQYLTLAEQERMNMAGAPTMSPKHYETLLPYAVALGVEKPWSKTFDAWLATAAAGAAAYTPVWYSGQGGYGGFGDRMGGFAGSMAGAMQSSLPPSPKSSSSGFSSGGGFSGGGGGGGGGGGW